MLEEQGRRLAQDDVQLLHIFINGIEQRCADPLHILSRRALQQEADESVEAVDPGKVLRLQPEHAGQHALERAELFGLRQAAVVRAAVQHGIERPGQRRGRAAARGEEKAQPLLADLQIGDDVVFQIDERLQHGLQLKHRDIVFPGEIIAQGGDAVRGILPGLITALQQIDALHLRIEALKILDLQVRSPPEGGLSISIVIHAYCIPDERKSQALDSDRYRSLTKYLVQNVEIAVIIHNKRARTADKWE